MSHKFSVILPTHNGADRIHTAISSITSQTFTDYELIVVCDACTDHTRERVEHLLHNQPGTVRIIDTSYQRDGLARNAGLNIATGEWILFIDDDDYFLHEYCFELLAGRTAPDKDVIDFSFIWKGQGYKTPSMDECFAMAWCRAWRRDFIGDERFNDTPYGSDKNFFVRMIQKNPNVRIDFWPTPIYYYNYLREGSLSWMEKQKTMIDIIITHYDEPWELGKPMFDMLEHQHCADMNAITVTLVQDGKEHELPWKDLLRDYSYNVRIVTIPHSGTGVARNIGMRKTSSAWIMFCNFDDHLADVCSLSMMLANLPNDEYNIIWGKIAQEQKWYTGTTYINCIKDVNFSNNDCKMYRREFLEENAIHFPYGNTQVTRMFYDAFFNTIFLSLCPPSTIVTLTTDFYPFFKVFRPDSKRHTLEAFNEIRNTIFQRDVAIAEELRKRNCTVAYRRTAAKAICSGYYTICTPEEKEHGIPLTDEFISYFRANHDLFEEICSSSDIDVIRAEIETEMLNLIQLAYNEHKQEFYFLNDSITFHDWVTRLDHGNPWTNLPAAPVTPPPVQEDDDENNNVQEVEIEHTEPAEQQPRVVVYCGTYDVYLNMIASCKSLLYHTPVDKVYFLTEDDTFPYDLPDIVENINIKPLATSLFPENGPNFNNAWSYMCMIRAAFPEIFDQYDRILSLDIDIVVNDNVSDLWDYDLTGYYLAGVPERQRQKSSADPMYINFGVVMMNLAALRNADLAPQIVSALNKQKFGCPEQDAYNKFCAGKILELPTDFNFTTYSHITGEAQKERILHYAGQKFWRHYANVKLYADMPWNEIMDKQNSLKGVTINAQE